MNNTYGDQPYNFSNRFRGMKTGNLLTVAMGGGVVNKIQSSWGPIRGVFNRVQKSWGHSKGDIFL